MIETAAGLILRTRPLTETSLIVHWLSPTVGRIATVAKGARRPKSPFRGKLDLFYRGDFSFVRSRRSDLHTLREVRLQETHAALRQELGYLEQASYAAALIEQVTETDTPLPAFFNLLSDLLRYLPAQPPQPQTVFAFELKLLQELGMAPDLSQSRLTPGAQQVVARISAGEWSATSRLRLSAEQVDELGQFLHGFLIFHLGRLPKSREPALRATSMHR
jgi:DNA repair protein RecO (recombination protein O)